MADASVARKPTLDRRIWKVDELELKPFTKYGDEVAKLVWNPVTYDRETGHGCFVIRFLPGGKSRPHQHLGFEEFYVLDGEIVDSDGAVFRAGDFVSFAPGTEHWSHSPKGAKIIAFMRGHTRTTDSPTGTVG